MTTLFDDAVTPRTVTIDVRGVPRPQGSMRLHKLPNGNTAARYPAVVYQWRAQVQQAVADAVSEPLYGPLAVRLDFWLPRPQSHYLPVNKRRLTPVLRDDAATRPTVAPDVDKLARACLDACTDAGAWSDDAQVAVLLACKGYADPTPSGVTIQIREMR